jgi:hypothetical protein
VKSHLHRSPSNSLTRLAFPAALLMCLAIAWNRVSSAVPKPTLVNVEAVNVAPVGWRRTVDGWELAEHWGLSPKTDRNINQWIALQRKQESSLFQVILERVRLIHPLAISTSMLLVVVAIAMIHERGSRSAERNAH